MISGCRIYPPCRASLLTLLSLILPTITPTLQMSLALPADHLCSGRNCMSRHSQWNSKDLQEFSSRRTTDPPAYNTRLATMTWRTMASDPQHSGNWKMANPHGDKPSWWPSNLVQGSEDTERTRHGGDQEQRWRLGKRLRIQARAPFCHEEQ